MPEQLTFSQAIDHLEGGILSDLFLLREELGAALAACRERKRLRDDLEQAVGNSGIPEGWLGSLVGGRVFNGVWGLEPGRDVGAKEQGDPGENGVLQPGDPGYSGNVLQPGDPGYGGDD